MTPDHADIAYVLEGVKGVVGVYAVDRPQTRGERLIDTIVRVEDVRSSAEAHYALLKILTHEDCERIQFCENDPSGGPLQPEPITLSYSARNAAMHRVSERARALEVARKTAPPDVFVPRSFELRQERSATPLEWRDVRAALVVELDEEFLALVRSAFPNAEVPFIAAKEQGVHLARSGNFDVIFCRADDSVQPEGFITKLAGHVDVVRRVIVVTHPHHRRFVIANLSHLRTSARTLVKPATVESIRAANFSPPGFEIVNDDLGVPRAVDMQTGTIVPSATPTPTRTSTSTSTSTPTPTSSRRAIVLLVDDEPNTEHLATDFSPNLHVIRASDEWTALEKIAHGDIDLVLVNERMRVAGDKPLYRLLWNARPDLKSRFALVIDPHRVPASARDGRTRGCVVRPVTLEALFALASESAARA